MFGISHSSMATREGPLCSNLSSYTTLRLPTLTTQDETLQPLETFTLCQRWIVFAIFFLWLKHLISIAAVMSLRTWGTILFRGTMLQYASSTRNLPVDDTRANTFPVGSILHQLHDDHRFFPDPFCTLVEFKVLLHKAEKITKRELSRQTPDSIGESFLITSTALRAYRNRHLGTLMRC